MAATAQRGITREMMVHGSNDDDDSMTIVPDMHGTQVGRVAKVSATEAAHSRAAAKAPPGVNHDRKHDSLHKKAVGADSPGSVSAKSVDLLHGNEESSLSSSTVLSHRSSDKQTDQNGKDTAMFSPATQTLNALSQNMDDLRYDMSSAMKAQESSSSSSPEGEKHAGKPPAASVGSMAALLPPLDPKNRISLLNWKSDYRDRYDWVPISFDAAKQENTLAGLGVVYQREQFFGPSQLDLKKSHPQEGKMNCQILRVLPGEWGARCGVQVGDWVCRPRQSSLTSSEDAPVLALFSEVQEWSKLSSFEVSVLREKKENIAAGSKPKTAKRTLPPKKKVARQDLEDTRALTASPSEQDAVKAMMAMVSAPPPAAASPRPDMGSLLEAIEHSERTSMSLQPQCSNGTETENHLPSYLTNTVQNDEVVPFCKLCNYAKKHGGRRGHFGRKPRMHHAWCPQGAFFDNNGSKELLDRVQQGRSMSCSGCDKEYQSGKLEPIKSHSSRCLENQKRLKIEQQEREEEEERKGKAQEQVNPPLRKRRRNIEAATASSDDEETPENGPRRKRQQQLDTEPPKRTKAVAVSSAASKASKTAYAKSKVAPHATTNSKEVRRVTPPPVDASSKAPSSSVRVASMPQNSGISKATVAEAAILLKSRWESTEENPWGEHGYQPGDVMLYGPQTGLGHHESMLPSPRYILNPFAAGSNYRTTHFTPEEGYTVLCLCRDPSGSSPWGFGVTRDEFGQACLVENVQPMTAASGAKALGSEEILGLKVHDMILMVNGHAVGGMTEVGLELELTTGGPRLTLVVSRYKHAEAAAQQRAAMERNMLRVMDRSCRDERLLGWHEVGNSGVQPTDSTGTLPLAGPEAIDSSTIDQAVSSPRNVSETLIQEDKNDDSGGEERPDHLPDETTPDVQQANTVLITERQLTEEKKDDDCFSGSEDNRSNAAKSNATEVEEEWEEDQNAWNGCVCGEIHKKPTKVFWIQCEECDSWYDVAQRCVGFSEKEAEDIERWICWACTSDGDESSPTSGPSKVSISGDEKIQAEVARASEHDHAIAAHKTSANSDADSFSKEPEEPKAAKLSAKKVVSTIIQRDDDTTTSHEGSPSSAAANNSASKKTGPKKKKPKVYKDGRPSWKDRQLAKTSEGNLLSNSEPIMLKDGTYRKPTGRVPKGFQWDKHRGLWAPKRKSAFSTSRAASDDETKATESVEESPVVDYPTADKKREGVSRDATSATAATAAPPSAKKPSSSEESISGTGDVHLIFGKGDLVFVQHHAWPGWNCEGGIGRVSKTYLNDDGHRLYDIKYVVGRSEKSILAEFVYSYTFG